jgi:hypothetical protein
MRALRTGFIAPVIHVCLDQLDRRLWKRLEPQSEDVAKTERSHVVTAE